MATTLASPLTAENLLVDPSVRINDITDMRFALKELIKAHNMLVHHIFASPDEKVKYSDPSARKLTAEQVHDFLLTLNYRCNCVCPIPNKIAPGWCGHCAKPYEEEGN